MTVCRGVLIGCSLFALRAVAADPATRPAPPHGHHDDHAHHDHPAPTAPGAALGGHHHDDGSSYAASLGLVAASYDAALYSGRYLGVVVGAEWSLGRFGVSASLAAYRLVRNGQAIEALGDLMVHGHIAARQRGPWSAGAMLMAMVPVGDSDAGTGMGHAMLVPQLWGGWTAGRIAATIGAGYARALAGASAHAMHGGGSWPLVDPMSASELIFDGTATCAIARTVGAGIRVQGAVPTGAADPRMYSGLRGVWIAGRAETSLELQHGLIGDPFGVRALIATAFRFR